MIVVSFFAIVYLCSLVTYTLTRNLKSRSSWYLFLATIIVSFELIILHIYNKTVSQSFLILLNKVDWLCIVLAQIFIFMMAFSIALERRLRVRTELVIFVTIVCPVMIIEFGLHVFTNIFIHYNQSALRILGPLKWQFPVTPLVLCYSFVSLLNALLTFEIIYKLYRHTNGLEKSKAKWLIVTFGALAVPLVFFALSYSYIHLMSEGELVWNDAKAVIVYELFFYITAICFSFAVLRYKLFFEEGHTSLREFIQFLIRIGVWAIVITAFSIVGLYAVPNEGRSEYFILTFPILSILAQSTDPILKDSMSTFFRSGKVDLPTVQSQHIAKALRDYTNLTNLMANSLLGLNCMKVGKSSGGGDRVEHFRAILDRLIVCFEPKSTEQTRSFARLKFEILRMMAYEGATDEQIMWDLGFEPDSDFWAKRNGDIARKPRFPYTGKGDYGATSRASFKRLKSQAIEDVRWRLEEMEKRENKA